MTPESCRRCGRAGVADPETSGWGDGGSLCPDCRALRNARARASATRIAAGITAEVLSNRPASNLATVRRLPDLAVLRSIVAPDWDGMAFPEVFAELGPGAYLVAFGDRGSVRYFAVEVGTEIEWTPVTSAEAERLPAVVTALLEDRHDSVSRSTGLRQRQHQSSSSGSLETAPTIESVSGSGQAQ